ncbi:MAG TPA: transglycosylase domain-containing protein [Natronosporangium sp.]
MSSYGHPQHDGYDDYDSYGQYEDSYAVDSYGTDPYPEDTYARGSARAAVRATASVAAASTGRARVAAPDGDEPRPRYDWSRGGSASATAPVSPGGPATGRATVRPAGSTKPSGPAGSGPGGEGRPVKKKKRHWLRNSILIALAVMVITTGGGMVALSYYVDSVPPPSALDLPEGSTIFYADGSEMATLQEVNREIIDTTVPELANVRNAVIAAEDKGFFEHSGVDFMGIARAAWNNAFGDGPYSGASTIDMQYTRAAAGLTEDSYQRKLQEAAMAYKLNQEYSKEEILDFYLNQVYLGRGAYGIQAAAEAYFGKDAVELSVGEAAMIAGIIRLPDDGSGFSPYDPRHEVNQEEPRIALERWNYVLNQMVDTGALTPEERAEMTELPETVEPPSADSAFQGPQGTIVQQVEYELQAMGITDSATGGYRITTTIDKDIQKAAVEAARRQNEADHWNGVSEHVDAAIVAIDPATGGVLAYYGGTDDGKGIDLAGKNLNDEGEWYGGWPPGSTAKIYTLVAELREGVSFDSHWKTSEYHPEWNPEITIRNAGRNANDTGCEGQAPDYCTLRWATQQSYNVPFSYFSERVPNGEGPSKILQAAIDAGITMMTDTQNGEAHDLTNFDLSKTTEYFFHPIAYGQYPITVLDHANGVATLAARGVYNKAHFIEKVEQRVNGEWVEIEGSRIAGEQRILQQHADAITGVLAAIPEMWGFPLENGRPAAAKTGTWEHLDENNNLDGNSDAWVVGYTPQIAAAVWVGDNERKAITYEGGAPIGSGDLPADIWQQFMNQAHAAKEYEILQFPPAPPVGNPNTTLANGEPPQPDRDDDCRFPFLNCDDDDDNRGGGGDNRGGDGDGGTFPGLPGGDPAIPPTTEPEPEP